MKKRMLSILLVVALILSMAACGKASAPEGGTAGDTSGTKADTQANGVTDAKSDTESKSDPGASDKKVTIRFEDFNASGDNESVLRAQIDAFNEVYPNIEIDLQTVAYDGYTSQLMAKISAGEAPDVFELSFDDLVSFAAKDVLTPLDDIIASQNIDTSIYNKLVLESFKYDGKLYGIPSNFSNVVMFYNKDLFDRAGVSYPTNEWTWADAEDAAKKIRALDENTYGYYRPITYNEFYKVIAQNGGSIMNADGTAFTVNTPEAVEAAEYMVSLVNDSNVQPSEEQMAGMGGWDLFKSGRLGMIMTGIWAIPTFVTDCEFNWDIEVEPGQKQHASHFFTNAFVVNKNSEVAEEAALFINFIASNPAATTLAVDANWVLPAVDDQALIDRYSAITPPNNKKSVFESVDYLVMAPVIEQSSEAADIVNNYLGQIASQKMTAQEALDACQKELDGKIKLI